MRPKEKAYIRKTGNFEIKPLSKQSEEFYLE
jgi:hypothetical protein